jgi:ankyrin repeat protein
MKHDDFRVLIERGDVEGMRGALESDPGLANRPICWHRNQHHESDPLHYVSDCVGQGWLTNGIDGEIVELLIAYGAAIDGNVGQESPLVAAASLGAVSGARVLIQAGAELEAISIFGARALHWAAWSGALSTVERLVSHGAELEARCSEFGATPLFWAVHGYGPDGPKLKKEQVRCARVLIEAGASPDTSNKHGLTAIELSKQCGRSDMYKFLRQYKNPQNSKSRC